MQYINKEELSNMLLSNSSFDELTKHFNCSHKTIKSNMYEYGLVKERKRKYVVNMNKFKTISNQEDAYWFGFILADGHIRKHSLEIELSKIDENHLEKLRLYMESTHLIKKTRKNCCRLVVGSTTIVNNLIKQGCVPDKTRNMPKIELNFDLQRHFYRGIFDGDGWITSRKTICKNNIDRMWEFGFSSADYYFITDLQKWLSTHTTYKGYLINRQRENQQVYQMTFGGNNVFKSIYSLLYKDSKVYLDRKKEKADEAINQIRIRDGK